MSTIDLNRRGLFKAGAVIAAASTISSIPVVAQAAEEPEKKIRPLTGKNLKMKDVLDRAREMMMPRCYVCAECNGRGPCIGQVPGFGGMGANRSSGELRCACCNPSEWPRGARGPCARYLIRFLWEQAFDAGHGGTDRRHNL